MGLPDETYQRILGRILKRHCKYVLQVLRWLAFRHVLRHSFEVDMGDGSRVKDVGQVPDPRAVLTVCSLLCRGVSTRMLCRSASTSLRLKLPDLRTHSNRESETLQFQRKIRAHLNKPDLLVNASAVQSRRLGPFAILIHPLALYAASLRIQREMARSSESERPMRNLFQPQSAQYINWTRLYDIDLSQHSNAHQAALMPPLLRVPLWTARNIRMTAGREHGRQRARRHVRRSAPGGVVPVS